MLEHANSLSPEALTSVRRVCARARTAAAVVCACAARVATARVRRRRDELTARAALAERARVARELHDTLLSDLASVAMRLDAVTRRAAGSASVDAVVLAGLRDQVRRTLVEARRAVTALRLASDDVAPLATALGDVARRVFVDAGVDVRVERTGHERRLPPAARAEVLRIASEAMTNARRHAGCRRVVVSCAFDDRELRLSVRDDGRGFDPARATVNLDRFGLRGMQERTLAIGGTLVVRTAPGCGTVVVLAVPLDDAPVTGARVRDEQRRAG